MLLEDHSDENHTAKYPLIDVELEQHFLKLETVKPVCYQLSIEWKSWRTMWATVESLQLSYSSITPVKVEMLERLVIFNWDQVSSSFDVRIHDTALTISDVWPWSAFLVCAQPNRILSDNTSWYIFHGHRVEYTIPPSHIFHSNGWSVWTNTRRLYYWPGAPAIRTLQQRYIIPHSIFLGATAEAFSSHSYYFDAIWFYLSHPSIGEAFHL